MPHNSSSTTDNHYTSKERKLGTQSKHLSKQKDEVYIIFPIIIEFKVVAKFLCNKGLADRLISFNKPFNIEIKREPTNKYDPRAI